MARRNNLAKVETKSWIGDCLWHRTRDSGSKVIAIKITYNSTKMTKLVFMRYEANEIKSNGEYCKCLMLCSILMQLLSFLFSAWTCILSSVVRETKYKSVTFYNFIIRIIEGVEVCVFESRCRQCMSLIYSQEICTNFL